MNSSAPINIIKPSNAVAVGALQTVEYHVEESLDQNLKKRETNLSMCVHYIICEDGFTVGVSWKLSVFFLANTPLQAFRVISQILSPQSFQ